jgi:hypothetical protein
VTKAKKPEKTRIPEATASTVPKQLTPWKPGQSGNPAGRAPGSRQKFSEAMVSDFLADWHEHGPGVLARVRATEPASYLRVASVLLPKDIAVRIEQDRNSLGIDPSLWRGFQRVLSAIEECAPPGVEPAQVFETLERLVRSEFAKPIEGK